MGRSRSASSNDYALPFDPIVFGEIGLCLFNLNTARLAWYANSWGILLYSVIFAAGLAYVAGLSLFQSQGVLHAALRERWTAWGVIEKNKSVRPTL